MCVLPVHFYQIFPIDLIQSIFLNKSELLSKDLRVKCQRKWQMNRRLSRGAQGFGVT